MNTYSIFKKLDAVSGFKTVSAHCDVPCGIYDPITAQLATLSVIRFLDLIGEMDGKTGDLEGQARLSRLVAEKESHAEKVKHEIRVIYGDYMKQPQFDSHPQAKEVFHKIMLAGSECKQHVGRANGEKLLELVNEFAGIFWETKGVETYTAKCPYAPAMDIVYPKLG